MDGLMLWKPGAFAPRLEEVTYYRDLNPRLFLISVKILIWSLEIRDTRKDKCAKQKKKSGRDIVSHSLKSALISTDYLIWLFCDKVYRQNAIF